MNPITKAVTFAVRTIGVGLIICGLTLYLTDLLLLLAHKPVSARAVLALKGVPVMFGLVVCVYSRRLTRRILDLLGVEEEEAEEEQDE